MGNILSPDNSFYKRAILQANRKKVQEICCNSDITTKQLTTYIYTRILSSCALSNSSSLPVKL